MILQWIFWKFLGSEEGQRLEGESGVAIPAYNGWGYLMIAPTIIGLIVLNVYPFIDTIILNFCKSGVFWRQNISAECSFPGISVLSKWRFARWHGKCSG